MSCFHPPTCTLLFPYVAAVRLRRKWLGIASAGIDGRQIAHISGVGFKKLTLFMETL
jgi:hypothetical protein